ncbi:hypothetical protein EYZ11_012926 [Aspergillus tanneri]|uniref:GST N-terminal domain-containing protein n=1 Tax=Aspergillus tanneri TaxID=1220188 RepID=A0A4S3IYZ7_9EURO|nr:hypothetical protein EYZ11_012926 [Aspergillus tanneri]
MKKGSFISINPNGRVPAIEDPNTWITLCESDAIVVYLVETYNKGWKISFQPGSPEYFHAKQWLHFQMSGQGPYFGQWAWLKYVHPEKFQSAQDPYMDETKRVSGVLDKFLEGREYLVGGRYIGDGLNLRRNSLGSMRGSKDSILDLSSPKFSKTKKKLLPPNQQRNDDASAREALGASFWSETPMSRQVGDTSKPSSAPPISLMVVPVRNYLSLFACSVY